MGCLIMSLVKALEQNITLDFVSGNIHSSGVHSAGKKSHTAVYKERYYYIN